MLRLATKPECPPSRPHASPICSQAQLCSQHHQDQPFRLGHFRRCRRRSNTQSGIRLLTEMLEVRILPGEPTPLSCSELRTFAGNSAIPRVRESRLSAINEDEKKSTAVGASAVHLINHGQTKHSACDHMVEYAKCMASGVHAYLAGRDPQ